MKLRSAVSARRCWAATSGLFVVFLFAPLVVLSCSRSTAAPIPTLPITSFSTQWFSRGVRGHELTAALLRSVLIAAINGLAATLLGIMAAVSLAP